MSFTLKVLASVIVGANALQLRVTNGLNSPQALSQSFNNRTRKLTQQAYIKEGNKAYD